MHTADPAIDAVEVNKTGFPCERSCPHPDGVQTAVCMALTHSGVCKRITASGQARRAFRRRL
jgi:hypothetical protein